LQETARADTYASANRYASGSNASATNGYAGIRGSLPGDAHVYTSAGDFLSGAALAYTAASHALS